MKLNPIALLRSSIKRRLIALTVVPLVLVTLVLTWHTIRSRQGEIEASLYGTGQSTADYLATISDFALYSGNRQLLDALANSALSIASVQGVAFLNPDREPLAASSGMAALPSASGQAEYQSENGRLLYFERPVYLAGLEVSDWADPRDDASIDDLIGIVVVAVDRSASIEKGREILINNLGFGLGILLLTAALTWYLSKTVVGPLGRLTRAVRAMDEGDLEQRILVDSEDELAELATGINRLAQSVANNRDNLENRVSFATRRLQETLRDIRKKNTELEKARAAAEAGDRAKGDFLAQMSHELRTPITAIQGFIRLIGEGELQAGNRRYCDIIDQAARQLLQLIDDILAITRLQSGSVELETMAMDLASCLENPIALMAPSAYDKGLELILDIFPDVPLAVEADAMRLRQILFNLIANAIKFTEEGYILVRVFRQAADKGEGRIVIQVEDTGIGVPEAFRQQIFEPFTQADNSISRRFGGTGLGLAIVKDLVNLMAGTIRVESKRGRGTVFTVSLPMALAKTASPILEPEPENFPDRILLYDPQPLSRQALEHLLSRHVEQINSCESIEEVEFTPQGIAPELAIYCPPARQAITQTLEELQRLREVTAAPILVIAHQLSVDALIEGDLRQALGPIRFIGRPPTLAGIKAALDLAPESSGGSKERAPLNNLTILVAEDNDFNSLLLETLLSRSGADCDLARDGAEAVALVDREAYDLILLDVHMPGLNGIDVIRHIRTSNGINRDTPVVMLTADVLKQEEDDIFRYGANALIFKPLNETKLLKTLQELTGGAVTNACALPEPAGIFSQDMFFKEIRKLTNAALEAFANGQEEIVRDNMHQLLGIAGLFKMASLERAVRQAHICVKKRQTEIARAALESLEMEVSLLEAAESLKAPG